MSRRLFTCDEYMRLAELGLFNSDERLELLNGEIVLKMPHTPIHAATITRMTSLFVMRLGENSHFRPQMPLMLDKYNVPEPDGAVVMGNIRDFSTMRPSSASLVIEVSEETLRVDRTTKLEIYAQAGIVDYWIININDRVVEVYREPAASNGTPFG